MVVNYVRKPPYHCMTRPTSACLTPRREYRGRLVTATVLSLYRGSQAVSLTGYLTDTRGGHRLTLPDKPDSCGREYRFIREAPELVIRMGLPTILLGLIISLIVTKLGDSYRPP